MLRKVLQKPDFMECEVFEKLCFIFHEVLKKESCLMLEALDKQIYVAQNFREKSKQFSFEIAIAKLNQGAIAHINAAVTQCCYFFIVSDYNNSFACIAKSADKLENLFSGL